MIKTLQALEPYGIDVITRIDSVSDQFTEIKSIRENMNESTVDAEIENLQEKIRDLNDSLSLLKGSFNCYLANIKDIANQGKNEVIRMNDLYQKFFSLDMSQSIVTLPVSFKFFSFMPKSLIFKEIPLDVATTFMIKDNIMPNMILATQIIEHNINDNEYNVSIEGTLRDIRNLINTNFNEFITESPDEVLYTLTEDFNALSKITNYITMTLKFMGAYLNNIISIRAQLNILSNKEEYVL